MLDKRSASVMAEMGWEPIVLYMGCTVMTPLQDSRQGKLLLRSCLSASPPTLPCPRRPVTSVTLALVWHQVGLYPLKPPH